MELDEYGLVRWAPRRPPVGPHTVADVLDAVLDVDPARPAVVDDDGELTYAELDTRANRIADVLRGEGIGPGDRLAVCLPNSTEIVAVFLAAMRIGAVWVGVNRALAPPEREVVVADSGAALVLAEPGPPQLTGARALHLDGRWHARVSAATDVRSDVVVDPHAPAAIAYTGGTTGVPKGAVHSQHNMLVPGAAALLEGRVEPASLQGVVLPLTILNLQILGPVTAFVCGATCVALRRIDVPGLADGVRRHRVRHISVPPTTAFDLLTNVHVRDDDLASLTDLGVGGAGAPPGLNERYRSRFGRMFATSYGLTEAPTAATVDRRDDRPEGSAGQALAHLRVAVTDTDGVPAATGEDGEIRVGPRDDGPFADVYRPMLGYWNRPEATRQALTDDGWLRTGDQGRLTADGSLLVVGRRNDLIVRGGANVYPAEVELALCTHPDVAEAAVIGRPDERLGETVVAVLRVRAGASLDAEQVRAHCAERLARYKVPADVRFVTEFPRNAMGKVVKKALRAQLLGTG